MFWLASPKDQQRITVARCWVHALLDGGTGLSADSFCFSWNGENIYRENQHNIIVRLNYCGPGRAGGATKFCDYIHHKGSNYIYAFNRLQVEAGTLISYRFGLRARGVGNYAPGASVNIFDDLGWFYGNNQGTTNFGAGKSGYYDDTKNLINSVSGRHAAKRTRVAGNQASIVLGAFGNSSNYCTGESTHPDTLPDPQPCGGIKPARSYRGVTYAADNPNDPDVGIKIRAHTGTVTTEPPGSGGACGASFAWVQKLSSLPGSAAPASWLTELLSEYPWIEDICPNPTSLTGGPGGSAPWSVAQALTRGDAANPNTGPNRNSPGGLP